MKELKNTEITKAMTAVNEKLKGDKYNKTDMYNLLKKVTDKIEKADGYSLTTVNVFLGELIAQELKLPEHNVYSATAKMFSVLDVEHKSVQKFMIINSPIEDEITPNASKYLQAILSSKTILHDGLKITEILKAMTAVNEKLKKGEYNKNDISLWRTVSEKIEKAAEHIILSSVDVLLGELIARELKLPEHYICSSTKKMFSVIDINDNQSVQTVMILNSPIEDDLVSNVAAYLRELLSAQSEYTEHLSQLILSSKMILPNDADNKDTDTLELHDIDSCDSCSDECIRISASLIYIERKSKIDERIGEAIDKMTNRQFINRVVTDRLNSSAGIVTPKVLFSEALELHDLFENNMDGKIHGKPFDKNLNMSYDVSFEDMVIEFAITVVTNDGTTVTDLPDSLVRYRIPQKFVEKYNEVEAKIKDMITTAYFEIAVSHK